MKASVSTTDENMAHVIEHLSCSDRLSFFDWGCRDIGICHWICSFVWDKLEQTWSCEYRKKSFADQRNQCRGSCLGCEQKSGIDPPLASWHLNLACCLVCWLWPAVWRWCETSGVPVMRSWPSWHLSKACTWDARLCPAARWQLVMCQPSWTLSLLVLECQPTSRWLWRHLMAHSPSTALRTCTSWIRLRRKAWSCHTPAELALAPAALARCSPEASIRAIRPSWMMTRWARDFA